MLNQLLLVRPKVYVLYEYTARVGVVLEAVRVLAIVESVRLRILLVCNFGYLLGRALS